MTVPFEFGEGWGESLRRVLRDGESVWQLRCPGCAVWADIDNDQLHGRVSVEHSVGEDDKGHTGGTDGCGYHETVDWFSRAVEESGRTP